MNDKKLATIQRIHSIQVHPNADSLSIARVLEWPVVIKKDQFKEGELVVFIEIDSIVPSNNPYFSFLEKQKYRVWNAKFRKMPSSGLVCPLSILPKDKMDAEGIDLYEGSDCTDLLQITKFERPIDISISGDAKGGFPTSLISISDEDNLLSHADALNELSDGQELYCTEKADGSSVSFIFNTTPHFNGGEFLACSRRLVMKENSGFPWTAANKYNLKEKMVSLGKNLACQCEAVGQKLNGNRMGINGIELRLFRAKNLDTRELYNYNELKELSVTLGIPIVKEIAVIKYDKSIHAVDWFKNLADKQIYSENNQPAEGIVISTTTPFYSDTLGKSFSLKVINSNYKQS